MKLNIIILAAGHGKRMHSSLPKALQPVGGMPMLVRVVAAVRDLHAAAIYVVHNNDTMLRETLQDLPVVWVEQQQQLGTAHAVAQVVPKLDGQSFTLILPGDVPLISSKILKSLIAVANNDIGLITALVANPVDLGRIVKDDKNNITAIIEEKDASQKQLESREINSGIVFCPTAMLQKLLPKITNNNTQREYYLTDIINLAVKEKLPIKNVVAQNCEEVLGANDKKQLADIERAYQRLTAEKLMQQGLTLLDPNRFDLRGELKFGNDVIIDANVIIEGKVQLGNNVQIRANCVIENAIIEDNCVIGPFARIRPGSHLKSGARVGNFVEVKNTKLGQNSKANHLTYLGDATIGADVNIGAGVITCNYDGANKHRTVIGDNVFVGSDCQFVAPVKIGKNATVGAGSTITEDVVADKLVIARTKQKIIDNWKRPGKQKERKE